MNYLSAYENKILDAWRASGRIAFYYPRKHAISLNGGRREPVAIAMARMEAWLALDTAERRAS